MVKSLGSTLKKLRNQKRLTQQELANRAGIERSYVTKLEAGTRGSKVSAKTLNSLAIVLDVSLDSLL
jgi:transcriptional regulator with XRE-family HTH domain